MSVTAHENFNAAGFAGMVTSAFYQNLRDKDLIPHVTRDLNRFILMFVEQMEDLADTARSEKKEKEAEIQRNVEWMESKR